jgi:hypothetical protein
MKQEELDKILEEHKLWLDTRFTSDIKGTRANLTRANLRGANLSCADLSYANLRGANLRGANLRGAKLSCADLRGANLRGANLSCAKLSCAKLSCADLRGAKLSCADLRRADLSGADLDYSCLPLWCGSLKANFDDSVTTQILYHLLSIAKNSNNVSQELKDILLTDSLINQANKFHRVDECGKIESEDK